ncbi:MAG: hypothetical protein ACODAD_01625 [Planctomycetota bacterium]
MVGRITVALIVLPLGFLAALSGCKNSPSLGLVQKETSRLPGPAASTAETQWPPRDPQVDSTGTPIAGSSGFEDPDGKSTKRSITHNLSKVKSWFPFLGSHDTTAQVSSPPGSLDSEDRVSLPVVESGATVHKESPGAAPEGLSNTSFLENSDRYGKGLGAALPREVPGGDQASAPGTVSEAPPNTPSLVPHSRRPPSDPAPKPPQAHTPRADGLSSAKSLARNTTVESRADRVVADEEAFQSGPPDKTPPTKAETEETDAAKTAKNESPRNSRLRFFPPSIGQKNADRSDDETSAVAREAKEGHEDDELADPSSEKRAVAKRGADTIPRREDLMPHGGTFLAQGSRPGEKETGSAENTVDGPDEAESPRSSASDTGDSADQTKWIAKKERAEADAAKSMRIAQEDSDRRRYEKRSSAVANNPTGSHQVVADTFANHNAPNRRQPPPSRPARQADVRATTSSQPSESSDARSKASRYVLNSHAAENRNSKSRQAAQQDTSSDRLPRQRIGSRARPSGTMPGNATPGQSGQGALATSIRQATGGRQAVPSARGDNGVNIETPQRHRRRPPVPLVSRRSSVRSYYHRGVLPDATALRRRPPDAQTSKQLASQEAHTRSATQSDQHLAPLIDADAYRRRMAQGQQQGEGPAAPSGTASRNTWVATYKKLLRQNAERGQGMAIPDAGTQQPRSRQRPGSR